MSGHSKWSKIKHKKGAADAQRGKLFAKLAKEIFVVAKSGDPDPENNAALRLAVEKAKSQSMPKDNIQRAIDRAKGPSSGESFEEIIYEGYGPNGVAIMAYCLTDNRNRTASNVRSIFNKRGGNLGSDGSVSYLFERKGSIVVEKSQINGEVEDFLLEVMEFPILDVNEEDDVVVITTEPSDLLTVKNMIDELGLVGEYAETEVTLTPTMEIELDEEAADKVLALVETLEDDDDVQDVYHNLK